MAKKTLRDPAVVLATPFLSRDEVTRMKRAALIREAGRVFRRRGFHQTSLDDVAKVLRVTKAALYGYVDNKQQILFECHQASLDLGDRALGESVSQEKTARGKVVGFIRRYIELITGDEGNWAVLSDLDALPPQMRETIVARRTDFDHRLRRLIKQGVAEGSIADVDLALCVFSFMGMINWIPRWHRPDGRCSSVEIAGEFAGYFERVLRPEPLATSGRAGDLRSARPRAVSGPAAAADRKRR